MARLIESAADTIVTPPGTNVAHSTRLIGPDVTRAIALVGVIVMNYHGYLNGSDIRNDTFSNRLFNPWIGVLSTRFAATFVTVAGIGITLMTRRGATSGDAASVDADRWRLRRRGFLLFACGYVLDWIWPGTILYFYGAYFIVGSFLFTLRTRWIVIVGTVSALLGAGIAWWGFERTEAGHSTAWLFSPASTRSPRNLVFNTFVNGTHPLFPWLAFLCAGLVIGRLLPRMQTLRMRIVLIGVALVAAGYAVNAIVDRTIGAGVSTPARRWHLLVRADPFNRQLLYVVTALGSSILAVTLISSVAERFPTRAPTRILAGAGRMTLSIYVVHIVVFNEVVHQRHWVRETGLDTALVFAVCVWVAAVILGWLWHRRFGLGPAERLYRNFGG